MSLSITLAIVACLFIAGTWLRHIVRNAARERIHRAIDSRAHFTATERLISENVKTAIAFDKDRSALCLVRDNASVAKNRVISPAQIVSVELFQDGDSITKISRSSQLGGAIIGGLALGDIGAVIGGLTGQTRTSSKIQRIELRIVIDDTSTPLHDLVLLDVECDKNNQRHKQAVDQGRHWVGLLDVLIKRADLETRRAVVTHAPVRPPSAGTVRSSVADEIRKLAALRAHGALTEDEFRHEKARLLGMQSAATGA